MKTSALPLESLEWGAYGAKATVREGRLPRINSTDGRQGPGLGADRVVSCQLERGVFGAFFYVQSNGKQFCSRD